MGLRGPYFANSKETKRLERSRKLLSSLKHGMDVTFFSNEKNFTFDPV